VARLTVHWEAVTAAARAAFQGISRVLSHERYYLAGGTALALYEGHRVSVDLDVFSQHLVSPETLAGKLEAELDSVGDVAIGDGAVYLDVGRVQVSIIGYRYPLLEEPQNAEPGLLPVAHRDDIGAMKLAAITARGTRKDFVDLWTLVTRHQPLDHYLGLYQAKYTKRDLGHVIRSLTYFGDADDEPPLRMIAETDWETVKADFRTWIRALLPSPPGG